MLKRKLSEHLADCFFGGEQLSSYLWELLTNSESHEVFDEERIKNIFHALVDSLEKRYPREHRLTDVRRLVSELCDDGLFSSPHLPWLDDLYHQLMVRRGSIISYSERTVNAYTKLAAGLDPTILVGWHLAHWIAESPLLDASSLTKVVSLQTSFFAPATIPCEPFAEGHVHFGGATTHDAVIGAIILSNSPLPSKNRNNHHWYNEQLHLLKTLVDRSRKLLAAIIKAENGKPLTLAHRADLMENTNRLPDWKLVYENNSSAMVGTSEWLLAQLALAISYGHKNQWLWLQLFLCRRYQEPHTQTEQRKAILCFWQSTNLIRRTLIMDSHGLAVFAERYYDAPIKSNIRNNRNRVERIWASTYDFVELKSSPSAFGPQLAAEISESLCSLANIPKREPPFIFGESELTLDKKVESVLNSWHYCAHFIRSGFDKNQIDTGKHIWETADRIVYNLNSDTGWNIPEFLGGKLNPQFSFEPANWFRGLDVAGDENEQKIEWFAPALRWLRNDVFASYQNVNTNRPFHFSIHAGEDYAHPVSGMRHIDETVKFCEMSDGDRLGHALALGIEPKLWADRQGEMVLSLSEHLDNLVWLWHYSSILSSRLLIAHQVQPLLVRRIERFWKKCWWWQEPDLVRSLSLTYEKPEHFQAKNSSVPINDLFKAWYLRRNCNYQLNTVGESEIHDSKSRIALPDYDELKNYNTHASILYRARHRWLQTDKKEKLVIVRPGDQNAALEVLSLKDDATFYEDVETPAEFEFMLALQDWLLNQYDEQGLIIETNPTSNVYIARLNDYTEHPIFRWSPPNISELLPGEKANRFGLRKGPMKVLINTDDPGVMPTTLRTEYALLRDAALRLNLGRTDAEDWLEKIRMFGLKQFQRNHLDVFGN